MAKNITFITVEDEFHIGGASTEEIVCKFDTLTASGIIDTAKAILCTINYVVSKANPEKGPVCIYFENGICVRLNLTAGYGGTGPRDTCKILERCKFDFDENDILSHQETVDLKYYKDTHPTNLYQFVTFGGDYIFSN